MSITVIILIITCLVSYLCFNNQSLFESLKHSPYLESRNKEYHRLISSGLVHGGWLHLFINMFVLYEFGQYIEDTYIQLFGVTMGRVNFLLMYVLTIIAGDLPTYFKHRNNPGYASVGASGAVSGIVFIYILLQPWSQIYLYGIIPIYSILAGIAYLAYSSWASKKSRDNVDHMAHFYGAIFGLVFTVALKPQLLGRFIDQLMNNGPF